MKKLHLYGLAVSTILSIPIAYTALRCQSFPNTPTRLTIDLVLRSLVLIFPVCLGISTFGYYRKFGWAGRMAKLSAGVFFVIIVLLIIEMNWN